MLGFRAQKTGRLLGYAYSFFFQAYCEIFHDDQPVADEPNGEEQ